MSNKKDDFTMNAKRKVQLDMPFGIARARLIRNIMFQFAQRLGLDICFKCGKKIETKEELSIEHKIPWLNSDTPKELFFDLDNIAFSHILCNIRHTKTIEECKHPSQYTYDRGCRCLECRELKSIKNKKRIRK